MTDQLAQLKDALKGTYAVERQIGAGGMATVYLARELKHGRAVAIKVLRPELSASVGTDRFLREIEMAARLQHPHILAVYDSGAAAGLLYYVMPFVEGESVRDRLDRDGRLPVEEAIRLAREVASALDYAHSHGVVHRDIKPENILLFGGHAVVADFGVARAVESGGPQLTGMGMAIGTPAYMSPEQATAEAEIDGRSDQYSLACVIYEMLTTERAFGGPTVQSVITKSISGPRPRVRKVRPDVPEATDSALVRALDQNPDKRFPTATAFADALESGRSGAYEAAARGSRRWMGVAAAAMLLLAAFVCWTALRGRPPVVEAAQRIAVLPFRTSGPDVELLGEGLVDLLSTNLDGVGGINTVEPRTVLQRWRERGSSAALDDALAVAGDVDAGAVLLGSVVQTGTAVRLSADLYARDGSKLGHAQVDGPADSVLALVDGLSLSLMREVWRSSEPLPSLRLASMTTSSPAAMRDYLRGEQFYRRSQWDSAATAYRDAVADDSTFALAHYRLATTYGWIGNANAQEAEAAGEAALRFASRLSANDQTIVRAYRLFQKGDVAATDTMLRYTAAHPDDVDGWYLLGESQYHRRSVRPLDNASLRTPFDRVLALDSSLTPAVIHPIELALASDDKPAFDTLYGVLVRAGAVSEQERWRAASRLLWGDQPVDSSVVHLVDGGNGYVALMTLSAVIRASERPVDARIERAEQILDAMPDELRQRSQADLLLGAALVGVGRMCEARAAVSDMTSLPNAELNVAILPVIGGYAPPGYADSLAREVNAMLDSVAREQRARSTNPFELYFRALFLLGSGDADSAEVILNASRDIDPESFQGPAFIFDLIEAARGAIQIERGDTAGGLAKMRTAMTNSGVGDGNFPSSPLRFREAMVLAARPSTRQEGMMLLEQAFSFDPQFAALSQLGLARAYEAEENYSAAADAYTVFLKFWEKADPAYRPQIDQVREALARVQRAGG